MAMTLLLVIGVAARDRLCRAVDRARRLPRRRAAVGDRIPPSDRDRHRAVQRPAGRPVLHHRRHVDRRARGLERDRRPILLAVALLLAVKAVDPVSPRAACSAWRWRVTVEAAILLAQAGEFAFIVIALGRVDRARARRTRAGRDRGGRHQHDAHAVPRDRRARASRAGSSGSSIATTCRRTRQAELTDHVIIGGYGRVGQAIGRLLQAENVPFVALDTNAELASEGTQARRTGVLRRRRPPRIPASRRRRRRARLRGHGELAARGRTHGRGGPQGASRRAGVRAGARSRACVAAAQARRRRGDAGGGGGEPAARRARARGARRSGRRDCAPARRHARRGTRAYFRRRMARRPAGRPAATKSRHGPARCRRVQVRSDGEATGSPASVFFFFFVFFLVLVFLFLLVFVFLVVVFVLVVVLVFFLVFFLVVFFVLVLVFFVLVFIVVIVAGVVRSVLVLFVGQRRPRGRETADRALAARAGSSWAPASRAGNAPARTRSSRWMSTQGRALVAEAGWVITGCLLGEMFDDRWIVAAGRNSATG